MDVRTPFFQNIACVLIGVLFLNPIVATAAQLTVDAQAGGNTSLAQAGNGVPIVNIAKPNDSGLSHNKFSEYNVGTQGLILNNATDKLQTTQLGGLILGNPNLKGQAAGLILNEVTGANTSQLKGYTEVAGKSAAVIVANPHGISCDGCGFINTPRVTLTTGKPMVENGKLDHFDVDGGQIAIEGAGLNASNVEQFDLITRSAKINAELHANQLNVIAGRNEVDAANLTAIAKADDGSAKPLLAIDSSALGGMYAGAIRLVGTEAGVGVRLAGDMASSAGDIRINANGQLSLGQTAASRDIVLKAQDIELTGKAYAGRHVEAQAQQGLSLAQGQSLAARERIELKGGQLHNRGLIEAGVNSDNSRNLSGDVTLSANGLRNSGSVIASRELSAALDGQLDNRAGTLSARSSASLTAGSLSNGADGRLLSQGSLTIEAEELDNRDGLIASAKDLRVTAGADLHNQAGEISSQAAISLEGRKLDNQGGLIAADSHLQVNVVELDNSAKGTLSSQGSLRVQAQELDNRQGGLLSSKGGMTLTNAALDNQGGVIVAEQQLSIDGKSLDNRGGLVSGKADLSVSLDTLLDNRSQGTVIADGKLRVGAAELRNSDRGQVAAKGDLEISVGELSQQGDAATAAGELLSQGQLILGAERIDNRQGGLIAASQGLDIYASELLRNSGGEISTQGQASIRVQAAGGQPAALLDNSGAGTIIGDQGLILTVQRLLNNAKGLLAGRDSLVLIGDSLDNRDAGTLSSQKTLSVQLTGELQNKVQGGLLSGGSLTVDATSVNNSAGGLLSSAGQLDVGGGSLNNQGGQLVSDSQLTISNSSLDNSNSGIISAKQALSIGTGQLDNQSKGLITTGAGLTVIAGQINNYQQGLIAAKGAAQVSATGLDQHDGGELISEAALTLDLQGGALNNSGQGLIATPGALLLNNLGAVNNSAGGEISSSQSFLLKASQLNNSAGRVISGQELQLQITQALLNNLKGVLSAAKLSVAAASLDNSGAGVLASQGDIQLSLTGKLDNHDQGTLSAGQALSIASASLDNSNDGLLASGGALQLNTGAANNQDGSILSQAELDVSTAALDNRGGVLSSQQALTLSADAIDNRDNGLITSAAALTLNAASLDSSRHLAGSGGEVSARQSLQLTVNQLIQQQGRLIGEAGMHIDFKGGELDNRGGLLSATGPLTLLNLGKLDNRNGGEVSSLQSYSLAAGAIDNGNQGRLISAGNLNLDLGSGTLGNAEGGLISGWKGLTVKAGSLDNSALGTLSSRDGDLLVELSGALNNSGQGALVSKGMLAVDAASLNNSDKGIVSSEGDLKLSLSGALNNSASGLIDSQGTLLASAGAINNQAGQIGSLQAASLTASSLDNRAGQLSSGAGLSLTLSGNLTNTQNAKLASAGPLVLKAAAIDNQGGSLVSQNLLQLTAASLNNANGGTLAARNGLNLLLTGALNNSADGLIHSQQGAIDLRAASLNNSGGTLSAQQDLVVKLDGKLDNQGGHIQSQAGNLDLQQSSALDNSNGVLSSLKGWLKLVTTGLFDNDAGTTQAQTLEINAKGIDNRGGHLSALSGDTSINLSSATFNNQGGGLYAHQLLEVIAGDFNNQGAAPGQGGNVAAGQIDFSLSGALNNGYGIVESASTLGLAVSSLDNRHGSLRALGSSGDTRIAAASLDNRNGKLETANRNLDLSVASLHSSGGRILHVGTGDFGLSAAQVMGAGGDLSTNGLLSLTADSWINSGVLQAGELVLNIGNFTQTATGQLLAGNAFTGSGTNWVNHGLLASDGTFSLNLSGAYSGNGQLSSLGDLSLSAASVNLSSSARIAGGGLTSVTSSGLLSNLGKLTSAGDLTVTANTLNNHGTLGSAEKLRLVAPTLLNESGLIFSGDDMTLRVNNFINRYADVYSLGAIDLARNDQGANASLLDNLSATLESTGDFSLKAAVINNARAVLVINDAGKYTAKITELPCSSYYGAGDCSGKRNGVWEIIERDKLEVAEASAASSIQAGGNLLLVGDTLTNSSSLISAGGNITANLARLENTGVETGEIETRRIFTSQRTRNIGSWQTEANQFTAKYWYLSPGYNPNNLSGLEAALAHFIGRMEREQTKFRTTTNIASGDQSYAAIIQAGGNVSITASEQINSGVIRPSYAYVAGGARSGDTATGGSRFSTPVSLNAQLPPDLQQQQVNPLTLPGFSLPQGEHGLFRLSGQGAASAMASAVQGAAGVNTLSASSVTVEAGETAQGPAAATGSGWNLQSAGNNPGGSPINPGALQVAGVQGLPSSVLPSSSHKYLIETNPELTNLKQFLGSDYMLGHLGYTPDTTQKRLGDGLYEQRLIREAVVARTGQRFLAGLTSDEAMFRYLMDNAIASKEALNLSVGISLSAAQVAALTHDIVWMEEHEVLGEKVLVPVLYLAQAEGRLAPNGALIQGRDVALISGGELNNQGTLRASDNLSVTAGNISNSGLMQAGERLSLLATDSIRNAQGGIISGRDVSAIALTGDIVNERSVTRHEVNVGNRHSIQDFVDNASRIEAAGSLSLSAGRDVTNLGGVFDSRGDLSISAGRDVTIAAVEERSLQARGSRYLAEQVSQHGAQVSAGRDIEISAGRDLTAIASRVEAGRDIALAAGNDVLIASAANEEHFYSRSKKVTRSTDSVRQQASTIHAGRDIAIEAGQDLTVIASQVKAGNNVALNAEQDINVLSAMDESASFYAKKSKGSFGRSKSKQQEKYDSTNIASVIEAGNDLTINTSKTEGGGLSIDGGRDVTVIGSQLSAGNDLLVGATGDVAILSGVEEHGAYSKKTKSGFLGMSKSGKSQLKTSATQVASELGAGNDVVIAAGNDIRLRASETMAGNDVELRAGLVTDTGDINLVSANDSAYSRSTEYKKKVGLSFSDAVGLAVGTPSWGGDIALSSAKKAGKEAISSTSVGSQVTADRDATLAAERDINIVGSGVSAGRNVLLDAGRDVNVMAGSSSQQTTAWEHTKTLGMQQDFDRNGFTTFVGEEKLKDKQINGQQTAAGSLIDAGLDIDIRAGRDIVQEGSDLAAGYDLNLQAGRNILIDAAGEQSLSVREQSQKRTGTTTTVNHNFGNTMDALSGAGKGDNSVSQASSTLKAVDSVSQFLAGPTFDAHIGSTSQSQSVTQVVQGNRTSTLSAGNDINLLAQNDVTVRGGQFSAGRDINVAGQDVVFDVARGEQRFDNQQSQSKGGIVGGTTGGFKVGIGGSSGTATQEGSQGTSSGAQLNAQRDVNLSAERDLSLIGTQVQAGRDIDLYAGNDLAIGAAANAHANEDRRRSGGGEVGLTFGSDGIGVYASVNIGRGSLDREGARQQEAYLYAGRNLNFESGRDTTVAGAKLEGENVTGEVGRNLTVSSVPDTGKVSGKEFDLSATVTIGYGASVSGSVGYGQTTGKTNWVGNQTSITARDRLDIRTEEHTQIDGAVLASQTGNLKLDTDTLGFRDIKGEDKERSYYLNAGGSYGTGQQDQSQQGKGEAGVNGWSLSGYEYEKEREQIVRATVGAGEIVVRSDAETGKDSTAGLNRDTSKAYEITKDKEERTDLYVSKSSLEAVGDPQATFQQWIKAVDNYGDSSDAALTFAIELLAAATAVVDGRSLDDIQYQQRRIDEARRAEVLIRKLTKGSVSQRKDTAALILGGITQGRDTEQARALAESIDRLAVENPNAAFKALVLLSQFNNNDGQLNVLPAVLGSAYAAEILGISLLATAALPGNQEALAKAASSVIEAAGKANSDFELQMRLYAELWPLVLGTAFPIHVLGPEDRALVSPIFNPLAGGNASSGGYNAGGTVITVPHTGGNQLDGQQGELIYTTPVHQLNPGNMYSEDGPKATAGTPSTGPRFIAGSTGNTIDLNYTKGLTETNVTVTGSRGGVQYPLQGQTPNSYANLGNGHVIVYGPDGRALYDVSNSRIKVVEWHQAPSGQYFPKKGSDTKVFEGNVPQSVLNDLGLN